MGIENYVIMNAYSAAILVIIFFHAIKFFDKNSLSDKLYMCILSVTAFLLVMDVLSRFDGNIAPVYPVINCIGNFVVFMMCLVFPSLWLVYVHYQVFDDERKAMRLFLPLGIINLAFGAVLVYSGRYGWFYYIDSDNIYHRGPLFWIPVSVVMLLIVAAFAVTVSNRRKLDRRSFYSLIFFAVPPFICVLLQTAFYGTSLVLSGVVLSMLVVFINIQNNRLHTDYLTGLGNRKKLDLYLGKKIKQCSGRKVFSAILIDINNFKRINETYGHEAGDDALLFAAKMLKRCIRNNDFIARYGGDEFCIVLDVSDENELKEIVGKIKSRLEECSDSGNCTYKLNFSMGYAVYDPSVHRNAKRFIRHIDLLMYENKRAMQGHGFCEMRQNL